MPDTRAADGLSQRQGTRGQVGAQGGLRGGFQGLHEPTHCLPGVRLTLRGSGSDLRFWTIPCAGRQVLGEGGDSLGPPGRVLGSPHPWSLRVLHAQLSCGPHGAERPGRSPGLAESRSSAAATESRPLPPLPADTDPRAGNRRPLAAERSGPSPPAPRRHRPCSLGPAAPVEGPGGGGSTHGTGQEVSEAAPPEKRNQHTVPGGPCFPQGDSARGGWSLSFSGRGQR